MTPMDELVATIAALRREDLEHWMRETLIAPLPQSPGTSIRTWYFSESECARIRLICTLHYDLEVASDTLPLILSLLDQLYASRNRLDALSRAISAQPPDVRDAILAALAPPGDDDTT